MATKAQRARGYVPPCPGCGARERYVEVLKGGGINFACDGCGYRGCNDDYSVADLERAGHRIVWADR